MVGALGRTDLLGDERRDELARDLFRALRAEILTLPDDLAVYPTHGAGSFCSAPSGSARTTTIGRERATNPLLRHRRRGPVRRRAGRRTGQLPAATSASSPRSTGAVPASTPACPTSPGSTSTPCSATSRGGAVLVDARPIDDYAQAHPTGAISIEHRPVFASWLGWLVPLDQPVVFVLDDDTDRADLVRQCLTIGHDAILGELAGGMAAWADAGLPVSSIPLVDPAATADTVVDVRQGPEWAAGHLPGAIHVELGALRGRDAAGRPDHGHVRPRRAGHDRRQPPRSGRPPRPVGPRRRSRRLERGHRRRAADRMTTTEPRPTGGVRLGLRENLAQFSLLVGVNALVGGMIGQERTVLPLLAEREFGLTAFTAALTFIAAFGVVKAATNFFAGTLSDRYGRKPVLVAGWLFGLPVPLLLMWAPSWGWVIAANVLLGVNQGLTWSTTVIMKIDLVGPGTARLRDGVQRGRRLRRGRHHRAGDRLHRRERRAATRTLLPRPRLRRARARPVGPVRQRDPRPRPPRGRHPPRPPRPRPPGVEHRRGVPPHQLPGEGAVVVQPGRAGQQPQRRPRLGPVPPRSSPRRG